MAVDLLETGPRDSLSRRLHGALDVLRRRASTFRWHGGQPPRGYWLGLARNEFGGTLRPVSIFSTGDGTVFEVYEDASGGSLNPERRLPLPADRLVGWAAIPER